MQTTLIRMSGMGLRQRDAVRSGLTVACQAPADGPGAGDAADADRRALARQRLEAWSEWLWVS